MYIDIGNRREVFWDDYIIDQKTSNANLMVHKPIKKEMVYNFDKPWESFVSYLHYIKLDDTHYMYYIAGVPCENNHQLTKDFNKEISTLKCVCVLMGKDPLKLTRPNLGFYEIEGSCDNNIILLQNCDGEFEDEFDNFFAFVDENPDCPPEERVKAIAQTVNHTKGFPGFRELWCYTSSDGIHFNRGWKLSGGDDPYAGLFDSLNTVHYDKEERVYKMYVRGLHLDYGVAASANCDGYITPIMEKSLAKDGIRDVRYMESKDFKTWSVPKRLIYTDKEDYPLYTNQIQRYERAPQMYIGIPTRYKERRGWNANFDQLGGHENAKLRKERMQIGPRFGLAITDAIFMCSRDGIVWNRFPGSFLGGELEHAYNWQYGDAYTMYNLVETSCEGPCAETELSILVPLKNDITLREKYYRYTLRLDGFASYHAAGEDCILETKPLIFKGAELSINFSTSAVGFVYIDILDETGKPIEGFHSCELFGNTTDRTVYFGESKNISELAGRPIKLRFTFREADLYSFIFR